MSLLFDARILLEDSFHERINAFEGYPECKMECIKELPVEDVMSVVEAQIKRIGDKFKKEMT